MPLCEGLPYNEILLCTHARRLRKGCPEGLHEGSCSAGRANLLTLPSRLVAGASVNLSPVRYSHSNFCFTRPHQNIDSACYLIALKDIGI